MTAKHEQEKPDIQYVLSLTCPTGVTMFFLCKLFKKICVYVCVGWVDRFHLRSGLQRYEFSFSLETSVTYHTDQHVLGEI